MGREGAEKTPQCRRMSCGSPLGILTVAEQDGAITALVLDGQKFWERHIPAQAAACEGPEPEVFAAVRGWLDAYFAGLRPDPGNLPLAPRGTAFQLRVWELLCRIPYGETTTYGSIARALGSSPRAVGSAVGCNPISILIPCHRVLGADGRLTGYAGGIERKRWLLELEGAAGRSERRRGV